MELGRCMQDEVNNRRYAVELVEGVGQEDDLMDDSSDSVEVVVEDQEGDS